MLYILHIVYFTCIFYILYILPITFLHITFSFPYDDDSDEDKLRQLGTSGCIRSNMRDVGFNMSNTFNKMRTKDYYCQKLIDL